MALTHCPVRGPWDYSLFSSFWYILLILLSLLSAIQRRNRTHNGHHPVTTKEKRETALHPVLRVVEIEIDGGSHSNHHHHYHQLPIKKQSPHTPAAFSLPCTVNVQVMCNARLQGREWPRPRCIFFNNFPFAFCTSFSLSSLSLSLFLPILSFALRSLI